jgi:hypothetical protein
MAWCEIYSSNDEELQSLLANTSLYNWWNKQHNVLEAQYLEDVEPYLAKSDIKQLRDLYDSKMATIVMYYSKPLVKQARKLNLNPEMN